MEKLVKTIMKVGLTLAFVALVARPLFRQSTSDAMFIGGMFTATGCALVMIWRTE